MSATPQWARYDEVAEAYDRFVVPSGYALLAKDLIALLELPRKGAVLDVGCGTGAGTLVACDAVGTEGIVVGVDVSLAMLRRASRRGAARLVAGVVPGLSFRDRVFDRVAASLVLSHLDPYQAALRDMVRVLKPGGRLGVTAWAGGNPGESQSLWQETAESFVSADMLRDAARRVAPWEEWFTDPAHMAEALVEAGLERVEVRQREYRLSLATADYLSRTEAFTYGRFMRWKLGAERWQEFRERFAEKVHTHFGGCVEFTSRSHLGVGRRPWR